MEELVQTYTRECLNNVVHCLRDSGCIMRLHEANQYLAQGDYARALEMVTGWPIVTPKDEMDESDDHDDNDPRGGPRGDPTHRRPSRREYRGDTPSDTDHGREVDTVEGELLLTEKHIREALELIIPDVTAIRIILTLVTKDHRSLIRRTR